MRRVFSVLVACVACTSAAHGEELAPVEPPAPKPAPEPSAPDHAQPRTPPQPAPGPPAPPRTRTGPLGRALNVAVEGRCALDLVVLGAEAFALVRSEQWIARLGLEKPELLPAVELGGLSGRWPDRLFAVVGGESALLSDRLVALSGGAWSPVDGLAGGMAIWDVVPWTNGRTLIRVFADHDSGARTELHMVGAGDRPDVEALGRACGEDWDFSHPAVDDDGNVGVSWSCGMTDRFAIFPAGARRPVSHRLPHDTGPFAVKPDTRGGFFSAYRSGRVMHVNRKRAKRVKHPAGTNLLQFDTDARGRIWLADWHQLYRQTGRGWKTEAIPGVAPVRQLAGVRQGAAWARRGGTYHVHGPTYQHDGAIHARDDDGTWHAVDPVESAFAADATLYGDFISVDDTGTVWILAHADDKDRFAILTNAPVNRTLRCP